MLASFACFLCCSDTSPLLRVLRWVQLSAIYILSRSVGAHRDGAIDFVSGLVSASVRGLACFAGVCVVENGSREWASVRVW